MSTTTIKPSRKFVDITFWCSHLSFAAAIILMPANPPKEPQGIIVALFSVALVLLLLYFFAIGRFAKNMGRSSIVWAGLSFLFSPVGAWVSYIASFFIQPRASA